MTQKKILFIVLLIFFMAACGNFFPKPTATPTTDEMNPPPVTPTKTSTFTPLAHTDTPTPTATETLVPTETSTPAPVAYGPNNFPVDVNPLTGLQVSDVSLLERRPIAMKVNIVPRTSNRPPWGLSFADIVYDYYHNAGYSRFHAIYLGTDAEEVGPIRSARLLDHELIRMYQSIFAYGSADALINQRILNSEYSDRVLLEGERASCPPTALTPLCRYKPDTTDTLIGGTQAITEYMRKRGVDSSRQNLDGMAFSEPVPDGGKPVSQVYIWYSSDDYMRWDYDTTSGKYLRFQDNIWDQGQGEEYAPLTEHLNDAQITAANVVIVYVRHEYYRRPPGEIVEVLLSGSGKAYAFRDGQVYEVVWNRPSINSVLYLTTLDGQPFTMKPGNTWFQLIGVSSSLEEKAADIWRFKFIFP
jgi:hypothetical protein